MTNRIPMGNLPLKSIAFNRLEGRLVREIEVSHNSDSLILISLEKAQAYIHII